MITRPRFALSGLAAAVAAILPLASLHAEATPQPAHGASMYGELKYGADFTHFDYTNPDAPKGGTVTLPAIGTFDNLNQFILKGNNAAGLGLLFDTLTVGSLDEPFSEYGLIAESIEIPEDRSWVIFTLRPEARWQDGTPITVDDVIWTLDTLKTKGHPFYRAYYTNIVKAEKVGDRQVKMIFDGKMNRELPLIAGQMPVLPKHYYEKVEFDKTTLTPPLGSGPYRIKSVDPGRTIVYERDPNYWGVDLPVNRGRYNFDEVRYEYYRDASVALEAFKAGDYDIQEENNSKDWATAYTGPAFDKGLIVREEIPNQRRHRHAGLRVQYPAGDLQGPEGARGARLRLRLRMDQREPVLRSVSAHRELLLEQRARLVRPAEPGRAEAARALARPSCRRRYSPRNTERPRPRTPTSATTSASRSQMLRDAGWEVRNGRLVNKQTGQPLAFEILLVQPAFERIVGPFVQNLEAPRHPGDLPHDRHRAVPEPARRLRLRLWWSAAGARASRPATSSATSGAAGPPTPQAAAIWPASRARWSTL